MNEPTHVMDTKEAYEVIVDNCVSDLETAYDEEGGMITHVCITCNDATTTEIYVSYNYLLGIDYDCDTNSYTIISAEVNVKGIEVATYDFDDYEITTETTRELLAINKRRLSLDISRRLDSRYT